jgi:hypothetical protein
MSGEYYQPQGEFQCLIAVSIKTMEIVRLLPRLDIFTSK